MDDQTVMDVPKELVPTDRKLIAKNNAKDFIGLEQFKPTAMTPKEFIKLVGC